MALGKWALCYCWIYSFVGIVSGFLGKDIATRTTLLMEKVMEEYADENLRILNEHELEEKELRRVY